MKSTDKLFQLSNVDAILLVSDKNRMYFTGFASTFGYLVLMPQGHSYFITDPRYYEMAQSLESDQLKVLQIANGVSAMGMVTDILKDHNVKTLGFEDTELTVMEYSGLQKVLVNSNLNQLAKI